MRLIATYAGPKVHAKVYRDSDWNEYRVKFFEGDKHLTEADYHTPDKRDALDVADSWTARTEAHRRPLKQALEALMTCTYDGDKMVYDPGKVIAAMVALQDELNKETA